MSSRRISSRAPAMTASLMIELTIRFPADVGCGLACETSG
jgi:hypothetical protein